ncbi:hypothetical protein BGZ72_010962 [Mortierella alpina]|nr:hypothetical protein BGZ72_010962 [Mortierella alpina]
MGVKDAFKFLVSRYDPEEVEDRHIVGTVQVDFHSLYIGYTANTLNSMKAANWRKPLAKQKTQQEVVANFVRALIKKFPPFLRQDNCILHLDGAQTQEKKTAHARRLEKFAETYGDPISCAYKELEMASDALGKVPVSDPPTKRQRRKILGPATRAIENYKKIRTFSINQEMTTAIGAALEDLGWVVHFCPGEADQCIANLQDAVVVTTDSDFLFRGARTVIRKDPKTHQKFTAYIIQDMLEALDLTADEWTALGVISGNDYADNVRGYAITTNYNILRAMEDTVSLGPSAVVQEYCVSLADDERTVEGLAARFQVAQAVFVDNQETLITDPSAQQRRDITRLEQELTRVLSAVSHVLERYRSNKSVSATERVSNARKSTSNRKKYAVKNVVWNAVAMEPNPIPISPRKRRRQKAATKPRKVARLKLSGRSARQETYRAKPVAVEHQTSDEDESDSNSSGSSESQSTTEDDVSVTALQDDDSELETDFAVDDESSIQEVTESLGEEDDADAVESDGDEDENQDEEEDENENEDEEEDENDDDDDMDMDAEEEAIVSAEAPVVSTAKHPQTLYRKLECHCAIIMEELGCLRSIVRRGVSSRYAEKSAEQFKNLEQTLLPLAHSTHQFALAIQSTPTPHALLIAAQQAQPAINASKAQYLSVMDELERFAPIGPELKTRLLEAAVAYHSELMSHVSISSDSSSSIIPTGLKRTRDAVGAVLKEMKQKQGHDVADNVVKFIQSIVEDMSDRYRYIILALEMFVAASVWRAESSARTLEEQTQFDEDLRALLDPRRSQAIARLLGIYVIGDDINLTKKALARATDRDRVNRIARTAAQIFRAAVNKRLQPIAPGLW